MAITNYDNIENNSLLTDVKAEEKAALNEVDVQYGNMISQADKFYQDQKDAAQNYADTQTELQNQKTDLAIKEIEQNRAQTKKDYIKEQSGAYVDWQKQSDPYGVNAEKMAAQGLAGSGYSESAQVSMYNTYQNRVATAREAYVLANTKYDNAIAEAKLQNSSVLAEIAYQAYQKQLELALQGFQYKNQLLTEQADRKMQVQQIYQSKWQDVYNRISDEITFNEQQRQYNLDMQYKNAALEEEKRQFDILHPQNTGGDVVYTINKGKSQSPSSNTVKKDSSANQIKEVSAGSEKAGNGTSSGVTVDQKSVLALGFGPISAQRLDELVASGVVEEYQSGNKLKYRKSASTLKQQMLLG